MVQIDALSPELAGRITTMITAAAGPPVGDERLHIQAFYDEQYGSMKSSWPGASAVSPRP